MDPGKFRNVAAVLSRSEAMDILRYLNGQKWQKASDVAKATGMHTATAVKYLGKLHDLRILARREGKGKTGDVFEYRLKSSSITIELDLNKGADKAEGRGHEALAYIYHQLMEKTERISGHQIAEAAQKEFQELCEKYDIGDVGSLRSLDLTKVMLDGTPLSDFLVQTINILLYHSEKVLGRKTTDSIAQSVARSATEKHPDTADSTLSQLQYDYFQEVR